MRVTHDKKNLGLNKFKRALNIKILSNKNYYVSENGNIFSSCWCINNVSCNQQCPRFNYVSVIHSFNDYLLSTYYYVNHGPRFRGCNDESEN